MEIQVIKQKESLTIEKKKKNITASRRETLCLSRTLGHHGKGCPCFPQFSQGRAET